MKKHRKLLIFLTIVIVLVGALYALSARAARNLTTAEPAMMTLAQMDLEQTVTATGTVRPRVSRDVTTTLTSPVDEIFVELGDIVEEDEALCRLESWDRVRAPIAGTVTAINVEEGLRPSGVLFTIQTLDDLEVVVRVPEYDMVMLELDLAVRITSDALEKENWDGVVKSISPVAVDTSGNFEVVITVTTDPGQLTGGMSARVSILCEQVKNVFAVPYDAVIENENGEQAVYVFVAGTEEDSQWTTREVVVTTGMESDYYIEIISGDLREGLQILTDPEGRNESSTDITSFIQMGRS